MAGNPALRLWIVNTQTHLLLASAVLGRRASGPEQAAILAGALAPDLSIFALAGFGAVTGMSGEAMWEGAYWSEPWQILSAISNSVPLWGAGLALALLVLPPRWRRIAALFCGAALLHLAFDLPVHAEDAHRHFWPLTDWRFRAPVSYWDPAYYGRWVSAVEAVGGLALAGLLWRRHRRPRARVALGLAALSYVAVPVFWIVSLGGA